MKKVLPIVIAVFISFYSTGCVDEIKKNLGLETEKKKVTKKKTATANNSYSYEGAYGEGHQALADLENGLLSEEILERFQALPYVVQSSNGKELKIEILAVSDDVFKMKVLRSGKTYDYPISKLVAADQEFVKAWPLYQQHVQAVADSDPGQKASDYVFDNMFSGDLEEL